MENKTSLDDKTEKSLLTLKENGSRRSTSDTEILDTTIINADFDAAESANAEIIDAERIGEEVVIVDAGTHREVGRKLTDIKLPDIKLPNVELPEKKKVIGSAAAVTTAASILVSGAFAGPTDILSAPAVDPAASEIVLDMDAAGAADAGTASAGAESQVGAEAAEAGLFAGVLASFRTWFYGLPVFARSIIGLPLWTIGFLGTRAILAVWHITLQPLALIALEFALIALALYAVFAVTMRTMFPHIPLSKVIQPRNFRRIFVGVAILGFFCFFTKRLFPGFARYENGVKFIGGLMVLIYAGIRFKWFHDSNTPIEIVPVNDQNEAAAEVGATEDRKKPLEEKLEEALEVIPERTKAYWGTAAAKIRNWDEGLDHTEKGASIKALMPFAAIAVQCVILGFGDIMSRTAFSEMPVFSFLTVRYWTAVVILYLCGRKRTLDSLRAVPIQSWLPSAALMSAASLSAAASLKYASGASTAFLFSVPYVAYTGLTAALQRKKPAEPQLITLGIFGAGACLLGGFGGVPGSAAGIALALLASLLAAGAKVCRDRADDYPGPLPYMTVYALISALLSTGFAPIAEDGIQLAVPSVSVFVIILYMALACSCLGFFLQRVAERSLAGEKVTLLKLVRPVLTAVLSAVFLSERVNGAGILGMLLILFAEAAEIGRSMQRE